MIVSNKEYYHFQRMNDQRTDAIYVEWKIGHSKKFNGLKENFYYSDLKNAALDLIKRYHLSNNYEVDLIEIIHKNISGEKLQKQIDFDVKKISNNDEKQKLIQFFQEIIYEQIRIKYFPNLPSRMNCIWVSKNQAESQDWENILQCPKSRMLLLCLNGIIHKTTGNLICADKNKLIKDAINNAHKYWNPNDVHKNEIEYLFEGEINIIKEI